MQLSLYQYNGHEINDRTNYKAYMPGDTVYSRVDVEWAERAYADALIAGKNFRQATKIIVIKCCGTVHSQIDELAGWFARTDSALRALIAKDTANSDKQWQLYCTPLSFVSRGGICTITLAISPAHWASVTQNSTAWDITGTSDTQAVVVGGNINAKPLFELTPTSAKAGGYAYSRYVSIYNRTDYPLTAGIDCIELTGTTDGIDTVAMAADNKCQADGDDIRVFVDGEETYRWFGTSDGHAIGTTDTFVWANVPYSARLEMTLKTAIASTDTITEIEINYTAANLLAMSKLPAAGTVQIDSERFTYTGINLRAGKLTGVTQGQKKSSAASHAASATVRWIEHDVYICYGSSDALAPEIDSAYKPIIDLGLSTNALWVWTEFMDSARKRSGRWTPAVTMNVGFGDSKYTTGSHTTEADPASEMGMALVARQFSGRWCGATAGIAWQIYHPAGFTDPITSSGEKYKSSVSSGWPASAALQKSMNGITWMTITNHATPVTTDAGSWVAWTSSDTSDALSGTYQYIRYYTQGSIAANVTDNVCALEVKAASLTLGANYPSVTMGTENSNYQLIAKITNNETAEWIKVNCNTALNAKVSIDCENRKAYLSDGTPVSVMLSTNRNAWLDLLPTSNTLQFNDDGDGTVAITGAVKWYDRSNVTG